MSDNSAVDITFIVILVIVFVFSCSGNFVVIIVTLRYLRTITTTSRFIVNLALADMLTGIAAALQIVYMYVPEMSTTLTGCLFRYQIVTLTTLTSQLTVTFTTLDRYLAVCHPFRQNQIMTAGVTNCFIAITWIYPVIVASLPFAGYNTWSDGNPCLYQTVISASGLLWMALTLWIFTIVTVVMYALILLKARSVYRRVRPSPRAPLRSYTESSSSLNINTNESKSSSGIEKFKCVLRGARATATVTLVFSLCWLPYTYFQIRGYVDGAFVDSRQWEVANWIVFLGLANSIMNPFIYAWQRKEFRAACARLLTCQRSSLN